MTGCNLLTGLRQWLTSTATLFSLNALLCFSTHPLNYSRTAELAIHSENYSGDLNNISLNIFCLQPFPVINHLPCTFKHSLATECLQYVQCFYSIEEVSAQAQFSRKVRGRNVWHLWCRAGRWWVFILVNGTEYFKIDRLKLMICNNLLLIK